jgi:hypothetical protein
MYDCQFEKNQLVHLHIAEQRGTASLISRYQRGRHSTHAQDVRAAKESEGRLVAPGGSRHVIELFLLNDRFGEQPGEQLIVRVAADGQAFLEGRRADRSLRQIDVGRCSPHRDAHDAAS